MNSPQIERVGSTFRVEWIDLQIAVDFRYVRSQRFGPGAEVAWFLKTPSGASLLHEGYLFLLNDKERARVASVLNLRLDSIDWEPLVQQATALVTREFRKGSPTVVLRADRSAIAKPRTLIHPFIYENMPFVFFGHPGCGKSLLGLLLALLATGARFDYPLPFQGSDSIPVLYLDWEGTAPDQSYRLSQFAQRLEVPQQEKIFYRRCASPLAVEAGSIQKSIMDTGAKLVIIDSLGLAAGGDLNASQSAQEFFATLRTLDCASIILAHNAKNADSSKPSTIYGSTFHGALARGIAEVRALKGASGNGFDIEIIHRKSNISRLQPSIGLKFEFDDEAGISVSSCDIRSLQHSSTPRVRDKILAVLQKDGPGLLPNAIAEQSDCIPSTIRNELRRLVKEGLLKQTDDERYLLLDSD